MGFKSFSGFFEIKMFHRVKQPHHHEICCNSSAGSVGMLSVIWISPDNLRPTGHSDIHTQPSCIPVKMVIFMAF